MVVADGVPILNQRGSNKLWENIWDYGRERVIRFAQSLALGNSQNIEETINLLFILSILYMDQLRT